MQQKTQLPHLCDNTFCLAVESRITELLRATCFLMDLSAFFIPALWMFPSRRTNRGKAKQKQPQQTAKQRCSPPHYKLFKLRSFEKPAFLCLFPRQPLLLLLTGKRKVWGRRNFDLCMWNTWKRKKKLNDKKQWQIRSQAQGSLRCGWTQTLKQRWSTYINCAGWSSGTRRDKYALFHFIISPELKTFQMIWWEPYKRQW